MAILLFFLFLQTTGSGGIALEPVEKIPVHFDWAENMQRMAYSNGKAYFASPIDHEVYVFDLKSRALTMKLGGYGNGPGEFPSHVNEITALPDRLAIKTYRWIHFFDLEGRFINRIYVRGPITYHIASFMPGKYLVGSRFLHDAANLSDISFIGVLNGEDGSITRHAVFGSNNISNNQFLSQYVFASNEDRIVVAQAGNSELNLYRRDGSLEKAVILERNPTETTFRDESLFTASNSNSDRSSIMDQRVPTFLVVYDIAVGTHFTVVAGYFQPEGQRRFLAIIDHSTWEVSYPRLESACTSLHLEGDRMVCLSRSTGMPVIYIYRISK